MPASSRDARAARAVRGRGGVGRRIGLPEPEETGTMFAENAAIKAKAAADPPDCPLSRTIPACASTPSTERRASSRPAGPVRTRISPPRWRGSSRSSTTVARPTAGPHFVSALVLAWPDGHTELFEGRVFGDLVAARGTAGFGYDPIFGRTARAHLRRDERRGESTASTGREGSGALAPGPGLRALSRACLASVPDCQTARSRSHPGHHGIDRPGPSDPRRGFRNLPALAFCAAKCPYCDFNSHVRHGA